MKDSLIGIEKMTKELHVCTCLLYSLLGCIKKEAKFLFLVAFSVIFISFFLATNIVSGIGQYQCTSVLVGLFPQKKNSNTAYNCYAAVIKMIEVKLHTTERPRKVLHFVLN